MVKSAVCDECTNEVIEGLPPMPPTPAIWRRRSKVKRCMFQYKQSNGEIGAA